MKLKEFDYQLPKSFIAQKPLKKRDMSRLMVLARTTKKIEEKCFKDIIDYLSEGDCLVLNDTRVMPVRLYGKRKTGGKVEIFIIDLDQKSPRALIKPSRRIKEGEKIDLENGAQVMVLGKAEHGRFVKFDSSIEEVLKGGHMPLPPYITRRDDICDKDTYQTVYSRKKGATASPTAGLHFTKGLLSKIKNKGVSLAYVTLHTGYGTFAPVAAENIKDHIMHSEWYEMTEDAAQTINKTKSSGGRVFAVGTTSTRVLETAAEKQGKVKAVSGYTDLFICPGYEFKIADGLITNFHLPKSTLLMLVSAFAEKDFILNAYKKAIELNFRFFSYGDAMLIV
ncbi:MAG: tRNA preQ1(34) S-adenosylmethionine ribosyltransferase-isomerase QueA [Candidatus Omnitrophota bacterium]